MTHKEDLERFKEFRIEAQDTTILFLKSKIEKLESKIAYLEANIEVYNNNSNINKG